MVNVLVVGDAILDHYVYGAINRQSPEDPSISVVDVDKEEYRLGGCMNVAANIRSISFPRFFQDKQSVFSVSLSSIFSQFTGKKLHEKGILCDDSCVIDERRQGVLMPSSSELIKTRIINEKTGKQLIRIDNRKQYSEANIQMYKDHFGKIYDTYDAVVVSDYAKGLVNGFTLEKLKNYTKPVFVDSKNPDLSFWAEVPSCIVKVNEREYKKATGGNKLKYLIVTRGSKGCALYDNSDLTNPNTKITNFPTKPIENADVIGAGDVFLAGLVVDYMRNHQLQFPIGIDNKALLSAIEFANMCAGISVKQNGTTEVKLW